MLVKDVLATDAASVDIKKDVLDVLITMLGGRERVVAVLDNQRFAGTVSITSYAKILRDLKDRKPESINIREIMDERPWTVMPNTNVTQVMDKLCEKGVYGVPVMSGHEYLGMVRRKDVLKKYTHLLKGKFRVQDAMSYHVDTNSVHDTVEYLTKKILMGYERRVVVMDDDNIKGTIDILDLANILLAEGTDLSNMSVEEILVPNAVTVSKCDDITQAGQIMMEWKIWGVPVVDKKLIGIARDKDLIQRLRSVM
ncbi:MAG: CBS domain-containing protein [Candidatus Altiarchaeota archaeon]|nr:CBS domain-containing protein [Candidatus Altiarchaeota archaeon]